MLDLFVPFPPSVNTMYPTVGKKRVLSEAGEKYYAGFSECVAKVLGGAQPPKWAGDIKVNIHIYAPKDGRKHDLDNLLKALFDGLVKSDVIVDDNNITKLHVEKEYSDSKKKKYVFLEVEEIH